MTMKTENLIKIVEDLINANSSNLEYKVYDALKMDYETLDNDKVNGIATLTNGSFDPIKNLGQSIVAMVVEFIHPVERLEEVKDTFTNVAKSSAGLIIVNSTIDAELLGTTGVDISYPNEGTYFNGTMGETIKTRLYCYFDINERGVLSNECKIEISNDTEPIYLDSNNEYEKLEYIEANGSQYIDTGLYGTERTEVNAVFQYTQLKLTTALFGAGSSRIPEVGNPNPTYDNCGFFSILTPNQAFNYYASCYGNIERTMYLNASPPEIFIDKDIHTYRQTRLVEGRFPTELKAPSYLDDGRLTYHLIFPTTHFTTPTTMKIFAYDVYSGGVSTLIKGYVRVYSFKIYGVEGDFDELLRDYVPARRIEDGVAGLYDLVNNVFYTNLGDGEFIAGNRMFTWEEVPYYKQVITRHRFSTTNKFDNNKETQTINDGQSIDISLAVPSIRGTTINSIKDNMLTGNNLKKPYQIRFTDENGSVVFENMIPSGDFSYEIVPNNQIVFNVLFVYARK